MKKIYFILLLLISSSLFSQYTSTGIGRWKLGLNVGGTWQTANINSKLFDVGYGATLEYAVHEDYDSFFGFSLRGRFLRGQTRGFNKQREYGLLSNENINGSIDSNYNYSLSPIHLNNKTTYNEFSLEAMLKWNRLYQNNGIVLYLYLGGGFTHYKVETNQQNDFGFMYDYSNIPQNASSTVNELKSLLDNTYETDLSHPNYSSLVFTPSVGIGFGFRVARGFDIVWEHKTSLPQTDLFEGQTHQSDDPGFVKDIYHYSSLGFILNIIGHNDPTAYTPPAEPIGPTTPIIPITTTIKPIITLIKPITNTFNTPNCKVEIEARIEYVNNQNNIEFYHNGNKVASYKYFFAPPTFKSTIDLTEGNNIFKIVAKNTSYSESKSFSLICNNSKTIEICHKDNNGSNTNMLIKETDWTSHKAHGDTKGNCPEKQITICHNIPGQGGKIQTITIPESEWNIHQSHGDYLGNCNEKKMITICHQNQELIIDEKDWSIHASHGDIKGDCPPPQVNMMTICHIPSTGNKRISMTIPENEWLIHQAHGDYKGTCPTIEPTIDICHKNNNGTKTNITIPEFRWNEHFAHGDLKGKCPEVSFTICHTDPNTKKKQNISITESLWSSHAAHGDTRGACPVIDKQITICHNIPGQPGKTQTITIPESQWLIHKSHGDKLGMCFNTPVDKLIEICHKNNDGSKSAITINESQWASHASHGDTKGKCPVVIDNKITICHNIPGQPGKTQTIIIPESQWLIHKSHGDSKGNCPEKTIQICHKNNNGLRSTITINESEWALHAAHGDTKGSCPIIVDKKITICHNVPGKPGVTQTISIPESQWLIHKSHGDKLGVCQNIRDIDVKVCHQNTTITIKKSELASHLAHGDIAGECKEKMIAICHKSGDQLINMNIKESEWPSHAAHGDKLGSCPDPSEFIEICHMTDAGGVQKTIHISKWATHKAHGDTKGKCIEDKKIDICHKTANGTFGDITILESQWASHQSHGDVLGKCPTDTTNTGVNLGGGKITICHYPPGNTSNPQTIEIPASAWAAHKAHGDVLGTCGSSKKSQKKIRKDLNGGK